MKKFLFCIIAAFMLCSCGIENAEVSDKFSIVTTVFPQYDFARNIGGDFCDYTMLLKPGSEAHTYEPTPADIVKIGKCGLFICVGGESESWTDKITESAGLSEERIIRLMDCDVKKSEIEEDHGERGHISYDEHVWTSPENAVKICEAIAEKMCALDSENAESYKANAEEYIEKLQKLDSDFKETVNKAERKNIIIADRFPLLCLTEAYGIEYMSAFPSCAEESEPAPLKISELINKVKKENIPVVFTVDFSNGKIAETVAGDTEAQILKLYSCHTLSADDFKNNVSYIDLMYKNLENIGEALK